MSKSTQGGGLTPPQPHEIPTQRWKVGYKWRKPNPSPVINGGDGVMLVERQRQPGEWQRGTLIVEVTTPLQLITRADRIARDMHPGCETKVTHLLGIVKDTPESGVR